MDRPSPSSTSEAVGHDDDSGPPQPPPYWHTHQRTASNVSYQAFQRKTNQTPIILEDHEYTQAEENDYIWARKVTVDDHVVVSGGNIGAGSYVVWNCTIETVQGGPMKMNKRYSEFDELRRNLIKTFPQSEGSLPILPPKSLFSKYNSQFLEKRKAGLAHFLDCVLLNPEFASSPILKDFLFA